MELQNIEYNGIEYEVKGLIDFSSLARLLFDLSKRQKDLENKYEFINESVLDKDQRLSELEVKINGESKSYQKKYDGDTFSQKSKPSNYESLKPSNYEGSNSNINNKEDDGLDSIHGNKISSDLIIKINKKVKDLEKKTSEMNAKTNKDMLPKIRTNQDNIKKSNNQLEQLEKNYEEINKKFYEFNEQFEQIKVKVEDFNIYDLFKSDSIDGGNIDVSKVLIMNLENKIFKKFSLYDEKNKKNENDLFKALEDIKTIKGMIDNSKIQNQRNNEKINEIEKSLNEYMNKNDNNLEDITNSIENIEEKIRNGNDLSEIRKEFDEKLKKLEQELKGLTNNTLESVKKSLSNASDPKTKTKMDEFDNNIEEIKKKINELEKSLNKNINNVDKELNEKISSLEKELKKKANSTDLNPINDKLYSLEENEKELNAKIDALFDSNDKYGLELVNFNKKLEYLSGDFEKFKSEIGKSTPTKSPIIDVNNFINQNTFNEFKKDMNTKNEKLKDNIDEINRNLSEITSTFERFITTKDFIQFQNNIMSILDEFKLSCIRRYMEKHDIIKSFRILENQIKSITETYKKMDGSDNWLLAKKPLNNFQCASCEALLKDIEKKDNFVAWNKYPNREEKTYRMGHGFSRMLQMVNEEIIKNLESKDSKGYVSDEDRKHTNYNKSKYNDSSTMYENKSIKLPKVNHKTINNDNYGMTVNKFTMNTSPYEETESYSPEEPKVTKIYKLSSNSKKYFKFNKTDNDNFNQDDAELFRNKIGKKGNINPMNMTQPK